MRKRDYIRLRRTCWALRKIEERISKVWERTYCSDFHKEDEMVEFEVCLDDVLHDLNVIHERVSYARLKVEDLLAKAYERN